MKKWKKNYTKTVDEFVDKLNEYRYKGMIIHEAAFREALDILTENFDADDDVLVV